MRNQGIVRLDLQFLASLLHLPEGHHIVATRQPEGFFDAVDVLVYGPTLPNVAKGHLTPRVQLQVTVTETETMVRERTFEAKFT